MMIDSASVWKNDWVHKSRTQHQYMVWQFNSSFLSFFLIKKKKKLRSKKFHLAGQGFPISKVICSLRAIINMFFVFFISTPTFDSAVLFYKLLTQILPEETVFQDFWWEVVYFLTWIFFQIIFSNTINNDYADFIIHFHLKFYILITS